MRTPLSVVILAAGKGSRMCSKKPKALQTLAGKYLIEHVLDTVEELGAEEIVLVHGHLGEQLKDSLAHKSLKWVEQKDRLGTGHAVLQAMPSINPDNKVLILYGDVPLISLDTLKHFVEVTRKGGLGILTAQVKNPLGLGRIIRNRFHEVEKIVEEKDATDLEKQIKEINTGIYCASAEHLNEWLPNLGNQNAQGEYYLTDIVASAKQERIAVSVAQPINNFEIAGVNTRGELAKLERIWHKNKVNILMEKGVSVADPARIEVRGDACVGQDSWLDINVILEGKVQIGEDCKIGANSIIINSTIADGVDILPNSIIENATIATGVSVGPFARIRPGTTLAKDVKIGNFVEIKNSQINTGSKVNHLSYVGDAELGESCNIGAGVITCNYDGANKHKTVIGDNTHVGSNCQLVAPVELGKNVTIGAGSTITKKVKDNTLALTRSSQKSIEGWQRPVKKKDS
tara:strand:- start:142 stop:1518 length:1377 start_codon:yes stop_codon:yes gene_type:complete